MLLSILIVAQNEEQYIEDCINSIIKGLNQIYYPDIELIIIDSLSTDRTIEFAKRKLNDLKVPYKILTNTGKTLTKGWNLGIKKATGKYIIRPDAHSILHRGYIAKGIEILEADTSIHAVGGVLETQVIPKNFKTDAIKFFLTSLIGMGNSNFRVKKESGYFDTVVYAIYRRRVFHEYGFFNEKLRRHEDTEMHGRLIKAGCNLYTCNKMISTYFGRNKISKLAKQMFMNGFYSNEVSLFSSGLQLRHHIPGLFYGGLLLLLLMFFFHSFFLFSFLLIFGGYIFIIIIMSIFTRKNQPFMIAPDVVITIIGHASYAFGYQIASIKRLAKLTLSVFK